jgi:hypothetical protein
MKGGARPPLSFPGVEIVRQLENPLFVGALQIFNPENRLLRQIETSDATPEHRAVASTALQDLRWYLREGVLAAVRLGYEIVINLATQWQTQDKELLPARVLLLWPAMALTVGATTFLSFDPLTRHLASVSGLKLLPEEW